MLQVIIATIEDEDSREFMTNLYLRCEKRMYREASKLFSRPSDIEDVVYEALAKLIDKIAVLQELSEGERLQYVIVTVKHTAINMTRRASFLPTASFDEMDSFFTAPTDASPEDYILKEQRNAYLRSIFSEISLEDRLLLEQKYILKWTDAEIAEGLSIQPASVRMRLTRTKRKIAETLLAQGFRLSDWV